MALSDNALNERYGDHAAAIEAPTDPEIHRQLRSHIMDLAHTLNKVLPDGRYKSLAMTDLENASMWAHKSMAIDNPKSKAAEMGASYDKD